MLPGAGARGRVTELRTLSSAQEGLLLKRSISPRPLHKALVLLDALRTHKNQGTYRHELLAFARSIVQDSSNLHFGPEVGLGKVKSDAPVLRPWLAAVRKMRDDLRLLGDSPDTPAIVYHADSRKLPPELEDRSVDAVITSPPYPNEKDYTRTTRLESVLLGFISSRENLRETKQGLVRANTRNAYQGDADDRWVSDNREIQAIARQLEERRIALGKTSGFERLYHKLAKHCFGGMSRHLARMRRVLRPGAQLAYVVGDQASYLRVMIRTGTLRAELATSLGYEVTGIDLFRTRLATATKEQLREEVVLLRWPGGS